MSQESDCEQKSLAMGNGAAYVFYTLIANMDAPVKYSDDPDDGTIPRIVGTIIASAPQQAITNTLTNWKSLWGKRLKSRARVRAMRILDLIDDRSEP